MFVPIVAFGGSHGDLYLEERSFRSLYRLASFIVHPSAEPVKPGYHL